MDSSRATTIVISIAIFPSSSVFFFIRVFWWIAKFFLFSAIIWSDKSPSSSHTSLVGVFSSHGSGSSSGSQSILGQIVSYLTSTWINWRCNWYKHRTLPSLCVMYPSGTPLCNCCCSQFRHRLVFHIQQGIFHLLVCVHLGLDQRSMAMVLIIALGSCVMLE